MDALIRDVRYALTTMQRNRGFAAAGLLTLALGIGATTAVFSVVYGVLVRPLPYPAADRLVRNRAMTSFTLPPDTSGGTPSVTRQMMYVVTPGYAEAVGLRLRQGRFFATKTGRPVRAR